MLYMILMRLVSAGNTRSHASFHSNRDGPTSKMNQVF